MMIRSTAALLAVSLASCATPRGEIEGFKDIENAMFTAQPANQVEACLARRLTPTAVQGEYAAIDALHQTVPAYRVRSIDDPLHRWRTEVDQIAPVSNASDTLAAGCLLANAGPA